MSWDFTSVQNLLPKLSSRLKVSLTPRKVAVATACVVGFHVCLRWYLNSWSKGEFGYFTPAMEVVKCCDLRTKTAVVTGCNASIGFETVKALYSKGAHVVMACRNLDKAQAAKQRIVEDTETSGGALECMQLELGDLASVRQFAKQYVQTHERLDILVTNAGVFASPKFVETKQGIEEHFGVNHLGHFYLTTLLTPILKKSAPSRVVAVSSITLLQAPAVDEWLSKMEAAVSGPLPEDYNWFSNYAFSKACVVLFARHFARLHSADGVAAVSLHPGVFATSSSLLQHFAPFCVSAHRFLSLLFFKDAQRGAATTTLCAVLDHCQLADGFYADCTQNDDKLRPDIRDDENHIAQRLWQLSSAIITDCGFSMSL